MPGSELFTIIALVEARDRAGAVIGRLDKAFTSLADSASRTAEVVGAAGEEIDTALLSSASGTDDLELGIARLAGARARLAKLTEDQAKAELDLLAVQEQVTQGALQGAVAQDALITSMRALDVAARNAALAEGQLAEIQSAQTAAAARNADAAAAAAASQSRLRTATEGSLLGVAKWGKAAMIGGAAAAFIGYEAVKVASNFDTLTTRLVTSANESVSNLQMIRNGIMEVSAQTGTSATQLAKSMYVVESAGYHGADGLKVLTAATEGAQQEGANFSDVANGVTDVLIDYHRPATDAANVTSQLVKAVSFGKSNFQTFSKALANVLPLASAMGLKLEDVTGVLSVMTAHGMTAARSSFNIANAMRSLEAPSSTMIDEFTKVGITAKEVSQHLSSQGLAGTMQWLSQLARKNAADLGQTYPGALRALMGTATGLQVALLTTGKNAKDVNKAIAGIGKATADSKGNVEGYAQTQKNIAYQMGKFKAAVVAAGIAIGNALIPALVKVMSVLNKFLIPVMHFIEAHRTMAAIIIGVAVGIGVLAAAIAGLNAVMAVLDMIMDANIFVLIALALVALVSAVIYAWNHWKTFRDVVMSVFNAVKNSAMVFWYALQAVWDGVAQGAEWLWGKMKAAWSGIKAGASDLKNFLVSAWNDISSVTSTVWNAISDFFKKWWPLLLLIFLPFVAVAIALWNHFHSAVWNMTKEVWGYIKDFLKANWDEIKAVAQATWMLVEKVIIQPVENIWNGLKSIWNVIKPYLVGLWNDLKGQASSVWQGIKQVIINPVTELWHWVVNKFDDLKNSAVSKMRSLKNDLTSIVGEFFSVGKDIVNGIIHGVENQGSALFSSLKNLANGALKAAKSFLGIGSPSKRFSDEVGKWITHGIAHGVLAHASVANDAVTRVAAGMTGTLSGNAGGSALGAALTGAGTAGLVNTSSGGNVIIDVHDNHVMTDRDLDQLVNKIGNRIATTILPQGGVRIRM